jgi:hypothetical protein
MYYYTSSGQIELNITKSQAAGASHQGACDESVLALSKEKTIARQLAKIDPAILASELKEYGAWDETELADHDQNLQRLLWLACGDINDGNF